MQLSHIASNSRPKYHGFANALDSCTLTSLCSKTRRKAGGGEVCWKDFGRGMGHDTQKPGTHLTVWVGY